MTTIDLKDNLVNEKQEDTNEVEQLVVFNLLGEEYAVDILSVQEIIRRTEITRVPKAPAYLKGVINLRGTIIPVIDSHLRFSLEVESITDDSRIIIFRINDEAIGMTVDKVTEVIRLSKEDIENPQTTKGNNENYINNFIKGIGKVDKRLLIILDIDKLLNLDI